MNFRTLFLQHRSNAQDVNAPVSISGHGMTLAQVVALARCQSKCVLDAEALAHSVKSAQIIEDSVKNGDVIYGVNTGFGGSAGTRTAAVEELQRMLMRGLHYGIMSEGNDEQSNAHTHVPAMPEAWARAAMAIRLNSLISGSSGISGAAMEVIASMLNADIVPRIPLRGSISASGDLSPLSYIGGAMQGKPSISVRFGERETGSRRTVSAHAALKTVNITPVSLRAKEGLAVTNGTAASAGVAALALHECISLYALSQVLTAMAVEALRGTDESFDPYFADIRPHPGQRESAHLIFNFLAGSRLVNRTSSLAEASLRQDRYSIRTAAQWTGPMAEDLLLAYDQIAVELNSVTDNPVIDARDGRILHGGNFQAKSVTTACDKLRVVLQSLGRMAFVQCTEMINPATNRGLAPNLVADEPSQSFIWKGTDIMVAALTSELGFLANPVGTHVQSAEMGNQALNSLALISARYTHEAVACVTQLAAAHLVALCQALDLRAIQETFMTAYKLQFEQATSAALATIPSSSLAPGKTETMIALLWTAFCKSLDNSTSMDSDRRFLFCIESLQPQFIKVGFMLAGKGDATLPARAAGGIGDRILAASEQWTRKCADDALTTYSAHLEAASAQPDASPYLGVAARRMYTWVRTDIGVPFIREENIRTPPPEAELDGGAGSKNKMGDFITRVYEAIKDDRCAGVVGELIAGVPPLP